MTRSAASDRNSRIEAQTPPSEAEPGDYDLEETRAQLKQLAGRRFGPVPTEPLIELVLRHSHGADWLVLKAAMEALARRWGFAQRDGIEVLETPKRSATGTYRVGLRGKGRARTARSYDTLLSSLAPLRTSCNCADFVRSSLGICKHGLVAFAAALEKKPSATSPRRRVRAEHSLHPELCWDPSHPLAGPADRLLRLHVRGELRQQRQFEQELSKLKQHESAAHRLRWVEQQLRAIERGRRSAEPAAQRVLSEEAQRARRLAANHRSLPRALASLSKLRRKLYDYQREGVTRFLVTGRLLLGDDMGLGKTTQGIACCHALFTTGRAHRGVLIVPAALKSQWKREWEETTPAPLYEIDGPAKERQAQYKALSRGFLLLGYEQLLRDLPHVQRFAPDVVLLDEAQRIKNWATKTAAYVKALDAEYRLVLTGTPMENRFDELASIMDFVDDTALEPKWRLVPWHTIAAGNGGRGVGGARNLATLRERLRDSFMRRQRAEVLSQLPKRSDTRLPVELTPAQTAEHEVLDQPIAALMRIATRRPLTQAQFLQLMQLLTRQRMICNGLAQVNFAAEWPRCLSTPRPSGAFFGTLFSPKLQAFRGLIEQLAVTQERKIVVFSQWRNMLRLAEWSVRDVLSDAGQRALFFTGAESRKLREKAIIEFHDDPGASVLFLSDAGGVGLNLQRAANCCINLELPWNPAVLEQRIGRIYRLGQKRPIDVINLVSEHGIEARIANLVAQKKAVFSNLFDGTTDEVKFDGETSFLEGIKKLVEPAVVPAAPLRDGDDDDADRGTLEAFVEGALGDTDQAESGNQTAPESESRTPSPGLSAKPATELSALLQNGMAGLSVQRTPQGGVRLEAPPELAVPLATLFESLARGLREGTQG